MHCEICTDPITPGQARTPAPAFGGTAHQDCVEGIDPVLRRLSELDRVTVAVDGTDYPGVVSGVGGLHDRHGPFFEAVIELRGIPDGWTTDILTIGQARTETEAWGDVQAYNRWTAYDDSPRYRDDMSPEAVLAYEEVQIDGFWKVEG